MRLLATFFALTLAGCSSSDTGTLTGHPDSGTGAEGGDSGGGGDSQGSPVDSGSPTGDSGLPSGSQCDPTQNQCAAGLLCCPVSGMPREGGVFNACMTPHGADGGC